MDNFVESGDNMNKVDEKIMECMGKVLKATNGRSWQVVELSLGVDTIRTVTIRTPYRYKLEAIVSREKFIRAFNIE